MPLEPYKRGKVYWAKGTVEFNGRAVSKYIRESTRSSKISGAYDWIKERTESELKRHHFGEIVPPLTVAEAATFVLTDAQSARYLIQIVEKAGDVCIDEINRARIVKICREILPKASTDTWKRWIVVPLQQLANAGCEENRCQPLHFKGFTSAERQKQDEFRGKQSRQKKLPGSWKWLREFEKTAPHNVYVLARFMFETAARIGQATELGPCHLSDISKNIVKIPAAKGHAEVELVISPELAKLLAELEPRVPRGWERSKDNLRVFGYASKDGPRKAWNSACSRAGIVRLVPHGAGRHGFATEMFVRQGVDVKTCTEYGRWKDDKLFLETYAHAEDTERKIMQAIRTGREQ